MAEERTFLYKLGGGFLIGAGFIIPGVSGSILAMTLGLYQPLIEAVARPFGNWGQKLALFLPVGLGAGSCLLLFSNVLRLLLAKYSLPTLYLFLGLVIGGLPTVFALANQKGFRLSYSVGLAGGLFLFLAFNRWVACIDFSHSLLQGLLIGGGIVVPGLSVSFLLMALGIYEELLLALALWDWRVLILTAAGALGGLILASRAVSWLFRQAYGLTYYTALGILFGSLFSVFPGWPQAKWDTVLVLCLFGAGLWFSLWLSRNVHKKKGEFKCR